MAVKRQRGVEEATAGQKQARSENQSSVVQQQQQQKKKENVDGKKKKEFKNNKKSGEEKPAKPTAPVPSAAKGISSNWLALRASMAATTTTTTTTTTKGSSSGAAVSSSSSSSSIVLPASQLQQLVKDDPALAGKFWPPADFAGITKEIALDCEMVGVGKGGKESILARVGITDRNGKAVLDLYVAPNEPVTDYRTHVTGILAHHLKDAPSFGDVQTLVARLTAKRIIVGHDLDHDFKALMMDHPRRLVRDTARFRPFLGKNGRPRALRHLVGMHLGQQIQTADHSPLEDARGAMNLYLKFEKMWEKDLSGPNKLYVNAFRKRPEYNNNNNNNNNKPNSNGSNGAAAAGGGGNHHAKK